MKPTGLIAESGELSLGLKKILKRAGFYTFFELSRKTRLGLKTKVKGLTVRHLVSLTQALKARGLSFYPDDSIYLDIFINQRKLFNLWRDGIYTYKQLDEVSLEKFQFYMGGPQSRFFRDRTGLAARWLVEHHHELKKTKARQFSPYLTERTTDLLCQAGVSSLGELVTKSDPELAQMLQPDFRASKRATPMTRARVTEIKYALFKAGINRPCKPL